MYRVTRPKVGWVLPPFPKLDRNDRIILPPVVEDRSRGVQLGFTGCATQPRFNVRLVALHDRHIRHRHLKKIPVATEQLRTIAEKPLVYTSTEVAQTLIAHDEMRGNGHRAKWRA